MLKRNLLLGALALLALSLLFPPWRFVDARPGAAKATAPAGYAVITAPPVVPDAKGWDGVEIDTARLVAQSLGLAAAIAALSFVRLSNRIPGRATTGIGLLALAGVGVYAMFANLGVLMLLAFLAWCFCLKLFVHGGDAQPAQ